MSKRTFISVVVFVFTLIAAPLRAEVVHIVYLSDMHYGIKREFRAEEDVPTKRVVAEMLKQVNKVPQLQLPNEGVGAGEVVGDVEAVSTPEI